MHLDHFLRKLAPQERPRPYLIPSCPISRPSVPPAGNKRRTRAPSGSSIRMPAVLLAVNRCKQRKRGRRQPEISSVPDKRIFSGVTGPSPPPRCWGIPRTAAMGMLRRPRWWRRRHLPPPAKHHPQLRRHLDHRHPQPPLPPRTVPHRVQCLRPTAAERHMVGQQRRRCQRRQRPQAPLLAKAPSTILTTVSAWHWVGLRRGQRPWSSSNRLRWPRNNNRRNNKCRRQRRRAPVCLAWTIPRPGNPWWPVRRSAATVSLPKPKPPWGTVRRQSSRCQVMGMLQLIHADRMRIALDVSPSSSFFFLFFFFFDPIVSISHPKQCKSL